MNPTIFILLSLIGVSFASYHQYYQNNGQNQNGPYGRGHNDGYDGSERSSSSSSSSSSESNEIFILEKYAPPAAPPPAPTCTCTTFLTVVGVGATLTETPGTDAEGCATNTFTCTVTPITPPIDTCKNGWKFFAPTKSCYFYLDNAQLSRNQTGASKYCAGNGGFLVSIHSEAENDFVKTLIPAGDDNVWIGYRNGAWTDGTPFDYSNFENFADTCTAGNCAVLALPNYKWKVVNCDVQFNQWICKKNA